MYFSRAGLFAISLTIAFFTTLTSAVPLPLTQNSLSNPLATTPQTDLHYNLGLGLHTPHSSDTRHVQHVLAIKNQHTAPSETDVVASRDVVDLVRRKSIFTKIKHAFQKVGHGIKHAAQAVGHGIKHAAKAVGHGIKTAAKKVGHFVKTTGAKIAKVGLKIWSTAQKVASKVAQFIPVVGKPLSKALDGASAITNAASNAIHAKIGGKLGKAMRGMDKTRKIAGYIPRELPEDTLEERDLDELDARDGFEEVIDVDSREVYDDLLYARDWDDFDL